MAIHRTSQFINFRNDEMNIEEAISELLFEYDCVIIPGFGGFIGNYSPAVILSSNHTFVPPSKSILFNINLKHNDGLLATHLSGKENITYREALNGIEIVVRQWNLSLHSGERVELTNLGQLFKDQEGNLMFTQVNEVNYLQESYGLNSFVSPAIRRDGYQRKLEKKISGYLDPSVKNRRILPRLVKWAAILVIPVSAAAILGITHFDVIRILSANYAGILFPESSKIPVKDKLAKSPVKSNSQAITVIQQVVPAKPPPEKPEIQTVKPEPFSIIVGAFKFKENAENLVSDLKQKGYDAAIVDQTKTGLYRVKLSSFSDKDDAVRQLALVRSGAFSGAWLLIK